MNEKLEAKKSEALNALLDNRCECFGVRNTIAWLIDYCDFEKEDLLALCFDEDDVDFVIENPDADYSEGGF